MVPAADGAPRAKLAAFLAWLVALPAGLPAADVAQGARPYPLASMPRWQVVTQPATAHDAAPGTAPWPLATPLARLGAPAGDPSAPLWAALEPSGEVWLHDARCGVVAGPDAARLVGALRGAKAQTLWQSGQARFHVYVRPVLPGETGGCPVGLATSLRRGPVIRGGG